VREAGRLIRFAETATTYQMPPASTRDRLPIHRRRRARHRQIQGPPTALAPRSVPLSGEPTGRACHTAELVVGERASTRDHHDVLHTEIA